MATLSASAEPGIREYALAFQCQGQGRTADDRIAACDRVIASGGTTGLTVAQALGLRASHLSTKHEYDRAIEDYTRSIQLDPGGHATYFNRGLAYLAKGDDARAIEDFDEQIRRGPRYVMAFQQRGMIWTRKQRYDLAIRDFDEVIRLYYLWGDDVCCRPMLTDALRGRARARLGLHDYVGAIKDFSRAITY